MKAVTLIKRHIIFRSSLTGRAATLCVGLLWLAFCPVQAAQIVFFPEERRFNDSLEISIAWDDPFETTPLYYTLNGSEPGPGSPVVFPGGLAYPILITSTTTVRAKSLADFSVVAAATFIAGYEAVFSTPGPGAYEEDTTIVLTAPHAAGSVIYYTLDGSEPTVASTVYATPLVLKSNMTVKAMVWTSTRGPGLVQSAAYAVKLSPVQFQPGAGEVLGGDTVSLTAKPGTTISYVINPTAGQLTLINSNPADNSIGWQTYISPLVINEATVIYAKAERAGFPIAVSQASYQIGRLPRPEFSPIRGPISVATPITITSPIAGAVIRYTLDGKEPSESSSEYTAPVVVPLNGRLKARAFHPQHASSQTRYGYYRSAVESVVPSPSDDLPRLKFTKVSESDRAVWITHAGDGSGRLFIVQLNGTIGILGQSTPFLSLPYNPFGGLIFGSPPPAEILSVAFPPRYDEKAWFYCSYRANGSVRVSKFFALANPDVADAQSEVVIGNYSVTGAAGQLLFGPDGTLYLNKVGSVASHMPAGFFQDSEVLADKLLAILTESGGEEAVEPAPGSWPFREYLKNVSISTVGALPYRGPGRRMQGRYFCGDRSSSLFTIEAAPTGNILGKLLARPTFDYAWFPSESPDEYPFDIVAMGEGEDGRLYVSNYGTTIYLQTGPGNTSQAHIVGGGIYRVEDDETVFRLRPALARSGGLKLSWHSVTGLQYQIQTSEDLITWQDYLTPFSGTGDAMQVNDSGILGVQSKFYRVRIGSGAPETP